MLVTVEYFQQILVRFTDWSHIDCEARHQLLGLALIVTESNHVLYQGVNFAVLTHVCGEGANLLHVSGHVDEEHLFFCCFQVYCYLFGQI